jgi:hypothetical protein
MSKKAHASNHHPSSRAARSVEAMPAPWWSATDAVVSQAIKMETRRQDQMLKAMDSERDGSARNRKPEEFPNTISVAALMDDSGSATSRIDIAGRELHAVHSVRQIMQCASVCDTPARDRTHQRLDAPS